MCMETPYFESSGMEEDMDSLMNDPSMVSTCTYVYVTWVGCFKREKSLLGNIPVIYAVIEIPSLLTEA